MKNLFVGIDLSLNSTGVSFISDTGCTKYLSIVNRWIFSTSSKKSYNEIINDSSLLTCLSDVDNLRLVMIDRKPLTDVKKIGLTPWARQHTLNCVIYSNLINLKIEEIIHDYFSDHKIHIGIENYSYGSFGMGTNTVQLIEITAMLKAKLFGDTSKLQNYHLIPGPSLKLFAGKGSLDKYGMFLAYLGTNKNKNDELFNFVTTNKAFCYTQKSKPIKTIIRANKKLGILKHTVKGYELINEMNKPLDDIIDSWWLAKHVQDYERNNQKNNNKQ